MTMTEERRHEAGPLSAAEKGILLYLVATDMRHLGYESRLHAKNRSPSQHFHMRGTSFSDVITQMSSAHILKAYIVPLDPRDYSKGKVPNPYRAVPEELQKATVRLVADGYMSAYAIHNGSRLIPNASAVDALAENGLLDASLPAIQHYRHLVATEIRDRLDAVPAEALGGHRGTRFRPKPPAAVAADPGLPVPEAVSWAELTQSLDAELGKRSKHTQRILERLRKSYLEKNGHAL